MEAPQIESGSAAFRKRILTIALAALIPIFTGAAYLTGLAYYETYLRVFHIPASLVSISTTDHFVYAHRTVTELGWSIFKNLYVLLSIAGFIFWVAFQWLLMDIVAEKTRQSQFVIWARRRFMGSPAINAVGRIFLIPTGIATVCLYLLVTILVLLVVPIELGGAAGRMVGNENLRAFERSCQKPEIGRFCNNLLENDKLIISGYIVASSEKNVIIYDGTSTFLLPRGEKTKITAPAINAKQ